MRRGLREAKRPLILIQVDASGIVANRYRATLGRINKDFDPKSGT